jgi:type I restriction enzyme, S subunit
MSFPRYPKYKDSGVAWLGDVPEHWEIWQSRRMFSLRTERAHADDEQLTASQKHGVIPQKLFMEIEEQRVVQVLLNSEILKHVEPGDFVISMRSFQGGIEYAPYRGCISSAYVMLIPTATIDGGFFKYLFKSQTYIQALQSTTNLVRDGQALRFQNFSLVPLPNIPLAEQTKIASFLDRETSKIDSLVGEQRRLIELLKEKRQAVISHAVTKGLNPHAPLKPSGIEWLGDVPEHWEAKRLKQLSRIITDGEHISPSVIDDGVPLLSAKDVRDWRIDYDVDKYVTEEDAVQFWKRCKPEKGDVLIVSRGATVGRIGVVEKSTAFCLMGSVILCKPMSQYEAAFLYFVLNAKHSQTSLWFSSASSAQQAIYIRDVAEVPVAAPPAHERDLIVTLLTRETANLDALTAEAERGIELLQERRTALISAAVTGKIDVRGLVKLES